MSSIHRADKDKIARKDTSTFSSIDALKGVDLSLNLGGISTKKVIASTLFFPQNKGFIHRFWAFIHRVFAF